MKNWQISSLANFATSKSFMVPHHSPLGVYRHHHSETLLAIAETSKVEHCDELADYCTDVRSVTAKIINERSTYNGR